MERKIYKKVLKVLLAENPIISILIILFSINLAVRGVRLFLPAQDQALEYLIAATISLIVLITVLMVAGRKRVNKA
ncbi:MAG: hypothetical protein LWY06_00120 [Firmicutes bacterium]|nr:hypothetical protein [Bacillota bacterium]